MERVITGAGVEAVGEKAGATEEEEALHSSFLFSLFLFFSFLFLVVFIIVKVLAPLQREALSRFRHKAFVVVGFIYTLERGGSKKRTSTEKQGESEGRCKRARKSSEKKEFQCC